MTLEEALEIISEHAYSSYEELSDGLPNGSDSDWGYDEQLVIEIAQAWLNWRSRKSDIEDPFVVWYFDGYEWSKKTKEMYQEDAYREWWRFTSGGKKNGKPSDFAYYYLGRANEVLEGRHSGWEEEDDFSIGYLLNKSFGE